MIEVGLRDIRKKSEIRKKATYHFENCKYVLAIFRKPERRQKSRNENLMQKIDQSHYKNTHSNAYKYHKNKDTC